MSQPAPAPENRHENDPSRQEKTVIRSIARSTPLDVRHLHFHKLSHDAPTLPKRSGTVILDLEDAVAILEKAATRVVLVEAMQRPRKCRGYVRVNALDTEFCFGDVEAVVARGVDGIILPKVERMLGAHGVTPLSPLFEDHVVELAYAMPPRSKLHEGVEKSGM